jgi:hypothetical protein
MMSDAVRSAPLGLVASLVGISAVVLSLFAWSVFSRPATWESATVVGAETFEINRARIPRTAAALVRGSGTEFGDRVQVLPVEGTGFVSVSATGDSAEEAEAILSALVPIVVHDLNRAGPDVGTFAQLIDVTTRPSQSPSSLGDFLLFTAVGVGSLSLSAVGLHSLGDADGTAVRN